MESFSMQVDTHATCENLTDQHQTVHNCHEIWNITDAFCTYRMSPSIPNVVFVEPIAITITIINDSIYPAVSKASRKGNKRSVVSRMTVQTDESAIMLLLLRMNVIATL